MKNLPKGMLVLCLICLLSGIAGADMERVVNARNEYGGRTVESTSNPPYQGGPQKRVVYFNGAGKIAKEEVFYNDQIADKWGYKNILYYDGNGAMVKIEKFYPEKTVREKGYNRKIMYFNYGASKPREEYYMDNKLVRTN